MRLFAVGLLLCALGAARAQGADSVPYGHPDFYPSAERPIGFRGDGNGYFPGARIVTEFWEGTPVEKEQQYRGKRRMETGKYLALIDDKPKNLVWKTEMPSWANSHPIVVGDKAFTTGESDWLVCTDVRTGKILWAKQTPVWRTACKDAAAADARRCFLKCTWR